MTQSRGRSKPRTGTTIDCNLEFFLPFFRRSVSTSQLNTDMEEESQQVVQREQKMGKKIKKSKKKKIFLNPQELLAKFKQEKLLKDFWTTTKQEEEFLRSRSSESECKLISSSRIFMTFLYF